jgi:hypothetical protein
VAGQQSGDLGSEMWRAGGVRSGLLGTASLGCASTARDGNRTQANRCVLSRSLWLMHVAEGPALAESGAVHALVRS